MNADDELIQLDDFLLRSYASLQAPVHGQREELLAALSKPPVVAGGPTRHGWNGPLAWLATAACLAVVAAMIALLVPSSGRLVYGVEAIPRQLAKVRTIRQRGYRMIYPEQDANGPPVRVPIDHLVKRPDKFRHTWYGVSYPTSEPMIVKRGIALCNGRSETLISQDDKLCVTGAIGLLDAWIKTEARAEAFLSALLGPPGVPYKKIGQERVGGRQCDVYEAQFGGRGDIATISRLWIDPTTGYPMRSTQDEVLADGSKRRVQENEEIDVNVPLEDELFEFVPPKGFEVRKGKGVVEPTVLSACYTSANYGGDKKLERWHAFRITGDAALVVWRRSAPEVAEDGTSDWLKGITFSVFGGERQGRVQHDWVYQSRSPDVWNWSLVAVVDDGPLPDRGGIRLELKSAPLESDVEMIPLRFPDKGLERIIEAASGATLPEGGPRFKLEDLRTLAGQLQARPKP